MMAARMLSSSYRTQHPAAAGRVADWLTLCGPRTLCAELRAIADAADLRPYLERLRLPVLLRVGEEDGATPATSVREVARGIPGSKLEVVAGKGHALLLEDLEATVASTVDFLLED